MQPNVAEIFYNCWRTPCIQRKNVAADGTSIALKLHASLSCTSLQPRSPRRSPMSVAKIIEISCESNKSFEDAIQSGIARASKTIHNIKGAWVKEQQVVIDNNKITMYRVDLKVTFILD